MLATLRERLACTISLRGNVLTLDGRRAPRRRGARRHRRARRARRERSRDRPRHRRRGRHRPRPGGGSPRRLRGRGLATPREEDRAEDRHAEALRRRDPLVHRHLRHRPGGDREDVPGDRTRSRGALEKQVGRIILTRPAVEAGERLGFLPGDLAAKVDPYMRPLFDALYDTMDADRLARTWSGGRSRSHRSRSCGVARSTTRSSSSTRRRTRHRSRCRCS